MRIKTTLIHAALCAMAFEGALPSIACGLSIIPAPVHAERVRGRFVLDEETRILFPEHDAQAGPTAAYLASVLRPATGYPLPVASMAPDAARKNAFVLITLDKAEGLGAEGYRLESNRDGVTITAPRAAGLFYGVQTLRQLMPADIFSRSRADRKKWSVPGAAIEDYPRFRWRGMMLDVARYFMPKEFILKFIDELALHKMNSLHLHLTDDQGWRIEIKKYPKLTEVGAWRAETVVRHAGQKPWTFDGERHGGFYTQDDLREIVAYAQERHINIVPEIEMPGHAQAAIAAYPELGNTGEALPVRTVWGVNENIFNAEESTILFLQDVLAEVVSLFPSPYIHVGGDEAVKAQWQQSAAVQARIQALGLKDEEEMQRYFIMRMHDFLLEKGRRLIGWDEILEGGLSQSATVMAWRGVEKGVVSAQAGHDVVMAPTAFTYFDYYQGKKESEPLAIGGFLPLDKVYRFDPLPEALTPAECDHILGAQGQIWTEYIETPEHAEYMAFPRTCALSEVVWTPQQARDFAGFVDRLQKHLDRLENAGVRYRKPDAKRPRR